MESNDCNDIIRICGRQDDVVRPGLVMGRLRSEDCADGRSRDEISTGALNCFLSGAANQDFDHLAFVLGGALIYS